MERFPIQYKNKGEFIPLGLMLEHEEQCLKNHYQSVQQLAKRGGTSYVEAYYILNDSEYKKPRFKEMEELGRYEENARKIVFAKAYEYLMNNLLGERNMQIGDKVKVLAWNPENDPDINPFPVGTIGTIVNYRSMYDNPYQVRANGNSLWYKAEHLELVTI